MAYIIYNSDGTILANIATGDTDSYSTSLTLVGKNVDNYGQYINNNFVKLLTNFANSDSPASPKIGQLWFDTISGRLNVYDGTSFNPTYGARVAGSPSSSVSTGDFWYDLINNQLKLWDGENYKLISPMVSSLLGKFGIELPLSTIREDDTNVPQDVSVIYSYGQSVGLITTSSFSMKATDALTYFNDSAVTPIVNGMTFVKDVDVKGDLYIKGDYYINDVKQFPNGQTLTATFDITSYGDPADATTATAFANISAGNIAIRNFLPLMFSTVTNVTYGDLAYPLNSVAKVVCQYNNGVSIDSSIRRFKLINDPIHIGVKIWNWDNVYTTTFQPSGWSTATNIVQL